MKDLILLVIFCLNIGLIFSRSTSNSCQERINGACGRGQHFVFSEEFGQKCVDCPKDTFLDLASHECGSCKKHTQPNSYEVIIMHGDSTIDNVVTCIHGFFRARQNSGVKRDCERCTVCGDGMWTVRECSNEEDTVCCPNGLVADLASEGGSRTCVLPDSRLSYQKQSLRKERSSGSNEPNSTDSDDVGNNVRTDDKSRGQSVGGDTQSSPDHGYSRADSETESRHNKVDFPVWARILCAGVAVGVFLFYLGVGIPCNACGSKDKLRAIKKWAFHRQEQEATEEGSKEKSDGKPKSTSDQV